jgi:hypothetical protein
LQSDAAGFFPTAIFFSTKNNIFCCHKKNKKVNLKSHLKRQGLGFECIIRKFSMGAVAKSFMRKGFLKYSMRKCSNI